MINPYAEIAKILQGERNDAQRNNPFFQAASAMPSQTPLLQVRGGDRPEWWEHIAASVIPAIGKSLLINKGQNQIDSKMASINQTLQGLRGAEDKAEYLATHGRPDLAMAFTAADEGARQELEQKKAQYQLQSQFDPLLAIQREQNEINNALNERRVSATEGQLALQRNAQELRRQELAIKEKEYKAGQAFAVIDAISKQDEGLRKDPFVQEYKKMTGALSSIDETLADKTIDIKTKKYVVISEALRAIKPEAINKDDYDNLQNGTITQNVSNYFKSAFGIDPVVAQLPSLRNAVVNKIHGMGETIQNTLVDYREPIQAKYRVTGNEMFNASKVGEGLSDLLMKNEDVYKNKDQYAIDIGKILNVNTANKKEPMHFSDDWEFLE